tara:strand:+ start:86 stop:292 length:207 start_codon:yes stop_codon:yes gene_type:complete
MKWKVAAQKSMAFGFHYLSGFEQTTKSLCSRIDEIGSRKGGAPKWSLDNLIVVKNICIPADKHGLYNQ